MDTQNGDLGKGDSLQLWPFLVSFFQMFGRVQQPIQPHTMILLLSLAPVETWIVFRESSCDSQCNCWKNIYVYCILLRADNIAMENPHLWHHQNAGEDTMATAKTSLPEV